MRPEILWGTLMCCGAMFGYTAHAQEGHPIYLQCKVEVTQDIKDGVSLNPPQKWLEYRKYRIQSDAREEKLWNTTQNKWTDVWFNGGVKIGERKIEVTGNMAQFKYSETINRIDGVVKGVASTEWPSGTVGYEKYPNGISEVNGWLGSCTKDSPWQEERKF